MLKKETEKNLFDLGTQLRKKYTLELDIVREIKETYPTVEEINLQDASISLSTKHHSIRYSTYSETDLLLTKEPTMVCNGEMKLPDTVEEFKAMKKNIDQDKAECKLAADILSKVWFEEFEFKRVQDICDKKKQQEDGL